MQNDKDAYIFPGQNYHHFTKIKNDIMFDFNRNMKPQKFCKTKVYLFWQNVKRTFA